MTSTTGWPAIEWPEPRLPINEIQVWALDSMTWGVQTPERKYVAPLYVLPDHLLLRIREEVESPRKPDFWLQLELAQIPNRSWSEWHWQRGIDVDKRRTGIPRFIREQVMDRDGLTCQICFLSVMPNDVHLDHIKPWSRGGQHTVANLRVTHSLCNIRKAARWDGDA